MSKRFERTAALVGANSVGKLKNSRVLVVGIGGVGGAAAEVLIRSGVGAITFVDGDVFEESNLNRQLFGTESTLGTNKAQAAKVRALEIDSSLNITAIDKFFDSDNADEILSAGYDYCIDAIDDVKSKTELILRCKALGIPIVSAMGAGNRLDSDFEITDLFKTANDPFARIMRRELKGKIDSLDVVCAKSPPTLKSGTPASIAAPPLVMGAMLANHALRRIIGL